METYTRSQQSQQIPQGRENQNGDTRNNKDLHPDTGVGYVHRLQGCILSYTHLELVQKIPEISRPGSDLAVQNSTIWSVHRSLGVHYSDQRGQTDGFTEGYKDPLVPRRLVGLGQNPLNLSPAYTNSSSYVSELDPRQIFIIYQFDLKEGSQTHPRSVADPYSKDPRITELMSLIGLLTATEKQVHLGRLHMRPTQWHLKNNWRVPESLEKVIPVPRSLI